MKKHIANIITGSRIVFSLPLIFLPLSSAWFYVFYLLCGLSDMVDGTVARRTNSASEFGARLDTVSDFVFITVALIEFVPHLHIPVWLWIWVALIALIKILNIALVFIAKKKLISIHSELNKITGFALFLLPLSLAFIEPTYSILAICVLATVAVAQEIYLVAKGRDVV